MSSGSGDGQELDDDARLKALSESGILGGEANELFDALTKLVRETLDVPVSLVSIVTDDRQVFCGQKGLPDDWARAGETPLSHSFCQHVVTDGKPLQVNNARNDPKVAGNKAISDLNVEAYLGTPIRTPDGAILGSLCAIDTRPREWQERDLGVLEGFAKAITADIAARQNRLQAMELKTRSVEIAQTFSREMQRVMNNVPVMIADLDENEIYRYANDTYAERFGATPETLRGRTAHEVMGETIYTRVKPFIKRALAGEQFETDLDMSDIHGEPRHMKLAYQPQSDAQGNNNGFVVSIQNQTEMVLLSRQASEQDQRLEAAHRLSPDGFMTFVACRNSQGVIEDFIYEYVNPAAARMVRRPVKELVGNRLLQIMPGNQTDGLFDEYVKVVETGNTYEVETHYQHDGLNFWVEITALKLGNGFAVSFSDISERKNAVLDLANSAVRLQNILDNVVAFVGTLSIDGTLREVNQPALDIGGLAAEDVIGKKFWEAFWWAHDEEEQSRLKRAIVKARNGEASRYDAMIRIQGDQRLWIDFQLNPIFSAEGEVIELIPSGVDITARRNAESHRELMVNELNHRVKNSLATIQAMARQTIRSAADLEQFETTFSARLGAISKAHDILTGSKHGKASMVTMVNEQVGPYADHNSDRLKLDGVDVLMSGPSAHALGLVFHELATNAAKYGALSNKEGSLEISWKTTDDGNIAINWHEKDGPEVSEPSRNGFGSRLIKQSLEYSLGGSAQLDFEKTGLKAELVLPQEAEHEYG